MARQIYGFSVTTPAGTSQATPQSVDLVLPPLNVDFVRIRIPPGPSGHLGFYLGMGGGQVIPYQLGEWVTPDGEVITETLDDFVDSGDWQFVSYNTGTYDHTVQLSFGLSVAVAPPLLVPAAPLSFA